MKVRCKCPVCESEGNFRYIKTKLYMANTVESDRHVKDYEWKAPDCERIRPLNYMIWYCGSCHFCDEMEAYRGRDKASSSLLGLIKSKFYTATRKREHLAQRLGAAIDLKREIISSESALTAYLLGASIQELLSPKTRHFGKLGRFYLRAAWIYRERQDQPPDQYAAPAGFSDIESFLASFEEEWPAVPLNEQEALRLCFDNYQTALENFERGADTRRELETMFLLTDLLERMGKAEESMVYVRQCHKLASEEKQGTHRTLNSPAINKMHPSEIEKLNGLEQWLGHAIERAKILSYRLKEVLEGEGGDSGNDD